MPKSRSLILILLLLARLVVACGSDRPSNDSESNRSSAESPKIVLPSGTFTTDTFVNAGWKKSKQYDTETVPDSTEIWYGFFQQKDIEIRFYTSHELAVSKGIPSAESSIESAVKRSKGGELLDFSGGSFSGYSAFLVAGNAVLLCELDRTHCDALIENLQ